MFQLPCRRPSKMNALPFSPFLLILLLLPTLTHTFCPTPPPVSPSSLTVYTKFLTELPHDRGYPASIISIKPFPNSRNLAVCTLTKVYLVRPNGKYTVFLDVEQAFRQQQRELNFQSRAHGGLRSIAFHPSYKKNRLIYISAMENRPWNPVQFPYLSDRKKTIMADSVLVEFKAKRHIVEQGSYRLLFRVGMSVFDHPIKQIEFHGRYLYIAHGDGSVQSASSGGGQNNDALGKILRIDPLKRGNFNYTIPKGNVFPNPQRPNMPAEVYAYGFRNPHHLSFTKAGKLIVADAGRDNYEEVNIVKNGANYGWSKREGTCVHITKKRGIQNSVRPLPGNDAKYGYEYPVAQYPHGGVKGAYFVGIAIAGGYPVQNRSPMANRYWYADFPKSGNLYFSYLNDMYRAVTRGPPWKLKQAKTWQVKRIVFRGTVYKNLYDVVVSEPQFAFNKRLDMRFGRGNKGELYWSSKSNGKLYVFTSSFPSAKK